MTTYLADYAYFTNQDDMYQTVMLHISAQRNNMNNTDRAVLEMIRRYSVKYGAAHLKHETMEKALAKFNATIRRAIRKLEQLAIIERIHFIRPVMSGLGANIYVIKPIIDQRKMKSILSTTIGENSLTRRTFRCPSPTILTHAQVQYLCG